MKLHYSQTRQGLPFLLPCFTPYKITLFSNETRKDKDGNTVLLPYKITLFSNVPWNSDLKNVVLLPYKITLFSN